MILIVKIIVSRWDSRNISLFLHTFLEINELMMDPVPVNSKFNFPNLSRISPVSGGKPPLFISACKYFCGWPCVNRESLVGRDQWRTSRFGSGRDSVLGKMFTWVSRRRVTAPLGAALCDDLRRYYAQNNKVDSLTYMYRGVCRSDAYTVHALPAWNRETYLRQAIIQWILSIGSSICESRPPTGIDPRLFLRKISLREGICFLMIDQYWAN